jgi:excinuclease ABC subunit C
MNRSVLNEHKGYIRPSEVNSLPDSVGVYIMKDRDGDIIYIGKAKSLKKRVASYFGKQHGDTKTQILVRNIDLIDYICVSNEAEALILEANLIKRFNPKFNVMFKDNKFYPFIRVTVKERFPRIVFARNTPKDGSLYFGPYTSAHSVRRYIDIVQKLFKIRTCREMPKRECLNYHINQCSAPCVDKVDKKEYREQVDLALKFLGGKYTELVCALDKEMRRASSELLFEKAQVIKEKIDAIRAFEENQHVFLHSGINADFVGSAVNMGKMLFVVNIVRRGRMVGKRSYSAEIIAEENGEVISDTVARFIIEYFNDSDKKQDAFIIGTDYSGICAMIEDYFKEEYKRDMRITIPRDKDEVALLKMANENSELHLAQTLSKIEDSQALSSLADILGINKIPMRIEGFDIANIMGTNAVASMVSFYGGKPDKSNYRRFKIRSKDTPDDFAMMREAVLRRYRRLSDEDAEFPDLILIDGGRGQLNSALSALNELGLELNIISLAKKNEEIYTLNGNKPIILEKNSPALHILQRVRDESHRFANAYYNKLKGKSNLLSVFDGIEGIGEKRKRIIIDKFLDKKKIETLTVEDIVKEGIPKLIAEKVYIQLKRMYN